MMSIENRLKLLELEKAKILGLGRSHLRSISSSRKLFAFVEKAVKNNTRHYPSPQAFGSFVWETTRERCDDWHRSGSFQFRVFDEGALEFLDQDLGRRKGKEIEPLFDQLEENLKILPNRARVVLQSFYQKDVSIEKIAKKIGVTEIEGYALWQHSLIYLWEEIDSEFNGFRGKEDENFWTLALRYLDGTASEKFVAELNQEIHVSKSRTKEFNDLRYIDGLLIAFGETERWPDCHDFENAPIVKKVSKPGAILLPSSVGVAVGVVGEPSVLFSETEKVVKKETELAVSGTTEQPQKFDEPPVLATKNIDQDTRHGVTFDESTSRLPQLPAFKFDTVWLKRLGLLLLTILGALFLVQLIKGSYNQPTILSVKGVPRVLQSVDVNFIKSPAFDGYNLQYGRYRMDSGTLKFQTPDTVDVIIEAPAKFEIIDDSHIAFDQGRMIAKFPSSSKLESFKIQSKRFSFAAKEGEFGIISDRQSTDLLVFVGEGTLIEGAQTKKMVTGEGLRFEELGLPTSLIPQDEAHRFPESLPVLTPKTYGDNLIINHSFEIGLLSRSCKTERMYRDIPLGWIAAYKGKDGDWHPTMEQHSGTVQLADSFGGLPKPAEGGRYLWINRGFVCQKLESLKANEKYRLSVQIGSHKNIGPSPRKKENWHFGIWTGKRWLAESTGQIKAGDDFKDIDIEFDCPKDIKSMSPYLMLYGKTRTIFYDNIRLTKVKTK